jgi:putative spermidine/putrescine transport system permease protein
MSSPRSSTLRLHPIALALVPALLIFALLFIAPMAGMALESFRLFTPGRIGAVAGAPFTTNNYAELLNLPFLGLFIETFRVSLAATIVGLVVSYPLAWFIVRRFSPRGRAVATGLLITLILLSMLVRTYAIELTFGSVGILRPVLRALEISPNSGWYIECLVGAGLLHYIIPVATLTLLGTVQNVDPRLLDAAQTLGAPSWRAHLTITLPLSRTGLVSAFLIALTFSISAFVIPMVLGKGRVLFLSNTIYNRFSEIADYPSGAAISIVMLAVSLMVVLGISTLSRPRAVAAAR